jgi:serine phosphatase RsbU (regulator of sigma subunit)
VTEPPAKSPGEEALASLLRAAHLTPPDDLPRIVAESAGHVGARAAQLLIVDHGRALLVPVPGGDPVPVDSTVAGRAFRDAAPQVVDTQDGRRVWLPLVDGLERAGVLGLDLPAVDDVLLDRCVRFAALVAEVLISKTRVGDTLVRAARTRAMDLAAEMQWQLMPPLTAGTDRVVVSAALEPAYQVGGDVIDYAISSDTAHIAVLDAMGHGVEASTLAAVAVGAYRNARREHGDLLRAAAQIDEALAQQFGAERFVTALLGRLDLPTGRLTWVNAGHPPALLVRGGHVIKELAREPWFPLGLELGAPQTLHEEQLEPGDRLVLYSDGVIEARDDAGRPFGLDRLRGFVERAQADGLAVPETTRRLSRAVVEHQGRGLDDDATHMLVEWRAAPPDELVP